MPEGLVTFPMATLNGGNGAGGRPGGEENDKKKFLRFGDMLNLTADGASPATRPGFPACVEG